MLKKINKEQMGKADHGWLKSRFHFSFADYFNANRMNFGVLRVLNDDIIKPNTGFDTHPHSNMEIISYIVKGEISHKDSMENQESLKRGEVQYLSAGDGIFHSEYNLHKSEELRLLQIWIIPPKKGLEKLYGSYRFKEEERKNRLLKIVSSIKDNAKVKIYQDINIYVAEFDKNMKTSFNIEKNRQIYFVQIEGSSRINNIELNFAEALEIVDEEVLEIEALEKSHFLFIEMKKS
ncbi:pirin family protein [Halarcobacter anaerophilus]|jgi:hypothetical protein|uniref:Pirin family protein n=1 Tax=Halarcobacter anaerophilus TaxID=877500 RepID=A0A4V1LQB1_9BACT|nr:pirin family protein [Halarcobacter anaerophilus]QDF27735.1 pirin family protein [Halarcobacter anaerophilus]RXJ64078.1 hypothetical protein CRV06_03825 [Halarcobacter anaerophilus]